MKLVMVEWVDSAFMQGWMERDAIKMLTLSPCVSIGLLVAENNKQITLVQSACMDKSQYGDGITIPKACIERIRYLNVKENCVKE